MFYRLAYAVLATVFLAAAAPGVAAFPDKPVRVIVGFPPGGSDIALRIVAQKLSQLWKQPVVVENRAGAGGNIGVELVAKSPADGYTMLLCVSSYAINAVAYKNLSWDLLRDFAPVGTYATSTLLAVVNSSNPAKTFPELIASAKANPGKLNYASAGNGTVNHLAAELFAMQTGVQVTHVPYKGAGPSVTALLANEVHFSFGPRLAFDAYIKDGRLRPLAVTSARRDAQLPDIPTVMESGVPGFDVATWHGLLVPAKTPPAIVKQLSDGLAAVMSDPDTQEKLRAVGLDPAKIDANETGELLKRDIARWREVSKRVGLSLD